MESPNHRIPVRFGHWSSAQAGEVVLVGATIPAPDGIAVAIWDGEHGAGCACCGGRSRLAAVLSSLFVSAMRGERPRFSAIVVDLDNSADASLRDALRTDRFLAARYVIA